MFNGFIKGGDGTNTTKSNKSHVRTPFVPFVDERDHLGQLRKNEFLKEMQAPPGYFNTKYLMKE